MHISTCFRRLATASAAGLALAMAMVFASGCVYRINIQQGNFLEAKDIDRVTVGMTRPQVRSLLGTPMVADPFRDSRWDYVYYLKHGKLGRVQQRHFIVHFDGDTVARIERRTGVGQAANAQGLEEEAEQKQREVEELRKNAEMENVAEGSGVES